MFARRLFSVGRQLISSQLFQNSVSVQSRTILNVPNKVTFIKTPAVEKTVCDNVIKTVNKEVQQQAEGRLFAVVHLCGKQYKVTAGDIVVIEGYWPPSSGDNIRLDKVLLAGGDNFTLIGRPLVQPGVVDVQATVIEKSIAHTRTVFRKKRRKNYMNFKFHRAALSMIRIKSITINKEIDTKAAPKPDLLITE